MARPATPSQPPNDDAETLFVVPPRPVDLEYRASGIMWVSDTIQQLGPFGLKECYDILHRHPRFVSPPSTPLSGIAYVIPRRPPRCLPKENPGRPLPHVSDPARARPNPACTALQPNANRIACHSQSMTSIASTLKVPEQSTQPKDSGPSGPCPSTTRPSQLLESKRLRTLREDAFPNCARHFRLDCTPDRRGRCCTTVDGPTAGSSVRPVPNSSGRSAPVSNALASS